MPVDPVRDAAVDALLRVFERGAFTDVAIDKTLRRRTGLSPRGRRFFTQLVYGTARHKLLCDHVLTPLLHQPLDGLPAPILIILRMGVFQALFCRQVTFPAMVHTSVDLAKKRGHAGTARLVNAVLKRVPQSLDDVPLPDPPVERLSTRYSIAPWIVEWWLRDYGPETARRLCETADSEAAPTARVNTRLYTVDELIAKLREQGHAVERHPIVENAIIFTEGAMPIQSKLFREGAFFPQDPASMFAPILLDPKPAERVLDLCAAPGGKTTHLAELARDEARVIALDIHPGKLARVLENATRLRLASIRAIAGDGANPPFQPAFDAILVDAPCTGLGTLRRHPELKWRTPPDAPKRLAGVQRALLRSAIALCKNGGRVVYSVCTFTGDETGQVVAAALEGNRAVPENGPDWMNPWKIAPGQYRILPQDGQLDGYFLTRLRMRS